MLLFWHQVKAIHSLLSSDIWPDKQIKSIMEVYLQFFVNWEYNDKARLYLIAEFVYNNAENGSTNYISFKFHSTIIFVFPMRLKSILI